METITIIIWIIAGSLSFISMKGDFNKLMYLMCWLALMLALIGN